MRVSRLMLVTLREIPADAEITSHQLLLKGGFIRRVASGVYAYLPLMWRVLKKITRIVQQEMDSTGALETLLPQLQPSELWKQSGRWEAYTAGEGIMFNLKDRQNRYLGLGPTHEEVITSLAKELINSYRQLPVTLYQTQTKFRDEIRPRFGLMRSREFIMKDAYSFHANQECLDKTYKSMDNAYRNIFSRCGLKVLAVEADSGAIGGVASQEFMVTAEAGEDNILTSPDGKYAANQEKAVSIPPMAKPLELSKDSLIETPLNGSINSLCKTLEIEASQVVKVILMLGKIEGKKPQPILISLRGDQELNEVKLTNAIADILKAEVLDLHKITPNQLKLEGLSELPFGAIGPDLTNDALSKAKTWSSSFLRIADRTAIDLRTFLCGANKLNLHRICNGWEGMPKDTISADLRNSQAGDSCVHDPTQRLQEKRGIEVGHIFQLGRKYSDALEARFTNEEGTSESFWMGCYGIGVSRLAQAAVEQNNDEHGIIWPISIAPFEVIIVIANVQDETQLKLGEILYQRMKDSNIDVLLDDRKERAGVKFKDADLLGVPLRVIVGRDAKEGKIELLRRLDRQSIVINQQDALKKIIAQINELKPPEFQ